MRMPRTFALVTISVLLLGCPQSSLEANLADKLFGGFLSIGHSVGNATKSVVHTFREWSDRMNPPKKVIVKGEIIEPFIMRMCGHEGTENKIMLNCLEADERYLLHSQWSSCLGKGGSEIESIRELLHWICHLIKFSEDLRGLAKIQECIFDDVDLNYAMTLYRLCAKNLP